jgi:Ca-activated chloride channel homolog
MGDAMQGAPDDHGRLSGKSRRFGSRTAALIGGIVVIVLLLALGARAVITRALCGQRPVIVNVATSLDIAPAVQRIGTYFNNLNRSVSGHCAEVEVTEENAQQVADQVSGETTSAGQLPVDAWVPQSSLWVDIVRSSPVGNAGVRETGVSLATSPLVVAVPRQPGQLAGAAAGRGQRKDRDCGDQLPVARPDRGRGRARDGD